MIVPCDFSLPGLTHPGFASTFCANRYPQNGDRLLVYAQVATERDLVPPAGELLHVHQKDELRGRSACAGHKSGHKL